MENFGVIGNRTYPPIYAIYFVSFQTLTRCNFALPTRKAK